MRVISAPDKAPVTGLIVLDRPPHLASGQGRQGRMGTPDAGAQLTPYQPSRLLSFTRLAGTQQRTPLLAGQ